MSIGSTTTIEKQSFLKTSKSQAYRYEQNPSGGHYRSRQLTDHQFAYGLVFLLIIVLLILLLPQFRGLGMLDVLNLD